MSVAFDGEAVVQQTFNGSSPITWTGKTTAGANRVGIFGFGISADSTITDVTWNGVSMTLIDAQTDTGAVRATRLYRIVNPPTGASDIVLSFTGSLSGYGGVTSYNGVDQSTPVRASAKANGTTDPATVDVSSAVGDVVVDALMFLGAGTPPPVGPGQTQRYTGDQGSWFAAGSEEAGAASVTMSWTPLTSPSNWAIVAASLQAATAATDAPPRSRFVRGPRSNKLRRAA